MVSIGQGRDDGGLRVTTVQGWEVVRFGIIFEVEHNTILLDVKCERELKRRVKNDFKYFGLHNGANGDDIYGHGDLQEKRE